MDDSYLNATDDSNSNSHSIIASTAAILRSAISQLDNLNGATNSGSVPVPVAVGTSTNTVTTPSPQTSLCTTNQRNATTVPPNQEFEQRVNQNLMRAFPGLSGRSKKRELPVPAASTKYSKKNKVHFQPKETWTHDFCVLSRVSDKKTPSKDELWNLKKAGLGREKVVFPNKNAKHNEFVEILEKVFPKLKQAGGIQLLHATGGGGGQRSLEIICPSEEGYSIPYLRGPMSVGQSVTFVKPLQQDLDMNLVMKSSDGLMIKCLSCSLEVPYGKLTTHKETECTNKKQSIEEDNSRNAELNSCEKPKENACIENFFEILDDEDDDIKVCDEEKVNSIQRIFINESRERIRECLLASYGDVDVAACLLTNTDEPSSTSGSASTSVACPCTSTSTNANEIFVDTEGFGDNIGNRSISSLLGSHKRKNNIGKGTTRIKINREDLWEESFALFKNPTFDLKASPFVKFEGESGIDAGGLSREYFTLLTKGLFENPTTLFEGRDNRKLLVYSADAIDGNLFSMAGKIVSYAICHASIGIPCLSPVMYEYISTGDINKASALCEVDDIADVYLIDIVERINACSTVEDFKEIGLDVLDALNAAGWLHQLTIEKKDAAVQTLIVHDVIFKRKLPLDEFRKGLKCLGILTLIQQHSEMMKVFFISSPEKLNAEAFLDIFQNVQCKRDDESEERARTYFINAIHQLYKDGGDSKLTKFLQFLTGLSSVPAYGFDTKIDLQYKLTGSPGLFAETCLLQVKLPTVHTDFKPFMYQVNLCCENYKGFGAV